MFKLAIAATCALLFVAVSATPYRDCGSTATLTAVRVPGCDVLPCIVYRGTNVSVQYDFVAVDSTNTLDSDVKGVIGGVTLPWPGQFPPACEDAIVGDCPVTAGESMTMSTILVLSPSFPSVSAKAIWNLRDDNGNPLVCFEVTVKLL
ncbi:NPC intracellular cholesterol transporter 2 homolog a-like [Daphnia pulex]|uniref:Putative Niemann-pick type C protein n=1 Tax=Daphnia pulex TaxID=6669 RepID=E9G2S0_DAPPU|nr:NPC intracellular cholesterol transporter 2 homolog a-like [Daphnia pulex]XP_046642298.1 NPC intracellular cholesterol transporter 2 homolog a-like [Daphnia pulicaria]EFX86463.1 putative Niemann-pick type C protein [Daphnia pulex]|eukprot:EFX86463.1 putative Niemann-pick type C protein [Daphnia pulex]